MGIVEPGEAVTAGVDSTFMKAYSSLGAAGKAA